MPGFAHIIFAFGFSVFLNRFSDGRFTSKHAIIFIINNFFGPDLAGAFFSYESAAYYFFHGYGWFIMALVLVIPYDIIVNQTSWDKDKKRPRFFDPNKKRLMTTLQVYFLIAAGGIFHLFIDIIGHPSYINYNGVENTPWGTVWFGGDNFISIQDIWGTGMFPCGNELGFWESTLFTYVYAAGIIVVVGLFYAHKSDKHLYKGFIILSVTYIVPLIIFYFIPDYSGFEITAEEVNYYGDPNYVPSTYRLVGGEADLGVLIYIFLFFFIPLLLIYYSINDLPLSKEDKPRKNQEAKNPEKQPFQEPRGTIES